DDGIQHVVHEHSPADDVTGEGVNFIGDIRVGGAGAGIDAGHASVADGGEQHRHHSTEDRSNHVATSGVIDHAVDAHGRSGLKDDDAVEKQVPELEGPAQSRS